VAVSLDFTILSGAARIKANLLSRLLAATADNFKSYSSGIFTEIVLIFSLHPEWYYLHVIMLIPDEIKCQTTF